MESKSRVLIYPTILISFILYIVFIFFFGENGLIVHKEKIARIKSLQVNNRVLYDKIYSLKNRLTFLGDNSPFYLEGEARLISLKKDGDFIIKLYNNELIEELAVSLEEFYEADFTDDSDVIDASYSSYHGEVLLGIFLNILVAFILTIVIPFRGKSK